MKLNAEFIIHPTAGRSYSTQLFDDSDRQPNMNRHVVSGRLSPVVKSISILVDNCRYNGGDEFEEERETE